MENLWGVEFKSLKSQSSALPGVLLIAAQIISFLKKEWDPKMWFQNWKVQRILQVSLVITSGSSEHCGQTVSKGRTGSKCPPNSDLPSNTHAGYTPLPRAPALRDALDGNPRAPALTLGTTWEFEELREDGHTKKRLGWKIRRLAKLEWKCGWVRSRGWRRHGGGVEGSHSCAWSARITATR